MKLATLLIVREPRRIVGLKMLRFLPLLMSCLNIMPARTEPIDSRVLGLNDNMNKNYWKEGFSKLDGTNIVADNHLRLQTMMEHHYKMDKKNYMYKRSRKTNTLNNFYDNAFDDFDELTDSINELTMNELNRMSTFLTTLLHQPSWKAPLVIVNDPPFPTESDETKLESSEKVELRPNVLKRTRYYRGYPYKRQNSRYQNSYDYDAAYVCIPTRDDIFQLLGALHDLRQGDKSRHVHFCNRRRTTRTLLIHTRFLGRRK